MAKYIILLAVFFGFSVYESEPENRKWISEISISNNRTMILYWTSVYEGQDSINLIKIQADDVILKEFIVSAQPIFNIDKSYVALPYCSTEGCRAEIKFIDLVKLEEIKSLKVPANGGFDMNCTWKNKTQFDIHIIEYGYEPFTEKFFTYDLISNVIVMNLKRIYKASEK